MNQYVLGYWGGLATGYVSIALLGGIWLTWAMLKGTKR